MTEKDEVKTAFQQGCEQGRKEAVKHGYWKVIHGTEYCPFCGCKAAPRQTITVRELYPYCAGCGARIDKTDIDNSTTIDEVVERHDIPVRVYNVLRLCDINTIGELEKAFNNCELKRKKRFREALAEAEAWLEKVRAENDNG